MHGRTETLYRVRNRTFLPIFGLLNILWCKFEYAFSSDWTELFYVGLRYFGRGACIKLLRESYIRQRVQNFQSVRFVAVFVCFGFYSNKKAPVFWTRAMETTGIEPVTPCMSSKYSNQLSYASEVRVLYHIFARIAIVFQIFRVIFVRRYAQYDAAFFVWYVHEKLRFIWYNLM